MGRRREAVVAAWREQLRTHGRVVVMRNRWLLVPLAVGVGCLGALVLLTVAVTATPAGQRALMALGGAFLVAVAGLVIASTFRGPALVVDADGLHLPTAGVHLPWRAVESVFVVWVKLTPVLAVRVRRANAGEHLGDGPVMKVVRRVDNSVTIGALLSARATHLAAWLDEEARRR